MNIERFAAIFDDVIYCKQISEGDNNNIIMNAVSTVNTINDMIEKEDFRAEELFKEARWLSKKKLFKKDRVFLRAEETGKWQYVGSYKYLV